MDGTLLDLGFDIHFWEVLLPSCYAQTIGATVGEANRRMRPIFEATRGTLDWYCMEYWSRALSFDLVALCRCVRHRIAWLPGARDFLASLRGSGRRLALVTNAHPEVLAIKDAQLGLRRHFDAVYCSHELGVAKEDPAFWPRLAGRERYDPRRTLYTDDTEAVLGAARGHGIGWLYAVRRPAGEWPARAIADFPVVDSVHELAGGLAPAAAHRPA